MVSIAFILTGARFIRKAIVDVEVVRERIITFRSMVHALES